MLDDKTRAELIEKYGQISEIDDPSGRTLVVRASKGHEQLAFMGKVAKDGANKITAALDYVRECSVYPENDTERAAIISDHPMIALSLAGDLQVMATGGAESRIRKN